MKKVKNLFEKKENLRKNKPISILNNGKSASSLDDNLDSNNNQLNENDDKNNLGKNNIKDTMTDNKSNTKQTEIQQPVATKIENLNTSEGNANLGNSAGDNADFSNRPKSWDRYGAEINGGNFSGGQNFFGGKNKNVHQNNYNNEDDSQALKDKIRSKINGLYGSDKSKSEKLQGLLWDINKEILEHAKNKTNWQVDWDLNKKICELGNQLGDIGLIEKFCKINNKEEVLEMRKEESITKQLHQVHLKN